MSTKKVNDCIYRILDANLNRAAEGLRVSMDLVRFALEDGAGSWKFRESRHEILSLVKQLPRFESQRLMCRDSLNDVGQELGRGRPGIEFPDIFQANLHRSQEALRALEDVSRGISPSVADGFNQARYSLYGLEKEFRPQWNTWKIRAKLDFDLYVVTSPELSKGRRLEEVAEAAIKGGAGCVQLRAKNMNKEDLLKAAKNLRILTAELGVTFIVNDHIDVAMAAGADGVHLGQEDFPFLEARQICGPGFLIGASTHNLEQSIQAERAGADYINVGPIFPTKTKEKGVDPVGLKPIAEVKSKVKTPQTCMGGIHHSNVRRVILQGAERVAVVSAVVAADDITNAARKLLYQIHQAKEDLQKSEAREFS